MTKKDFQLIADVIRALPYWTEAERATRKDLTVRFADRLAETNPRFDRDGFIRACWYC